MTKGTTLTIRGTSYSFDPDWTKADIARYLFAEDEGYNVNEVSKAIPMAYSQASGIWNKMPNANVAKTNELAKLAKKVEAAYPSPEWDYEAVPRRAKSTKPLLAAALGKAKKDLPKAKIGRLRTPGLPSDIAVGACINCEYDLVVRNLPTGYVLVHTGVSAEEYLATVQFCTGVPEALVG